MINRTHQLRKKVCQFLGLGYYYIHSVEEWSNCLFVKLKKGFGLFINRFVSKRALQANLPTTDDHYYISILGKKTKVNVKLNPKTGSIEVYSIGSNPTKLGEFDVMEVKTMILATDFLMVDDEQFTRFCIGVPYGASEAARVYESCTRNPRTYRKDHSITRFCQWLQSGFYRWIQQRNNGTSRKN